MKGLIAAAIAVLFTPVPIMWNTPVSVPPEASFRIQLSESVIDSSLTADVWELDLFESNPEDIAYLNASGATTVCYMSLGTWEEWRPDADRFPTRVLGNEWPEWPGERYVDIRAMDDLRPIVEARLDLCRDKGFVAVDIDNIDSWGAETGFPLTRQDAERFAIWLAYEAHARGLAIGQKNAPELTSVVVDVFDFAVTEDCAADGWCADMRPYLEAGKAVFAIEYTDVTDEASFRALCGDSAMDGYSLVYKRRNLDAWSTACPP